MSSSKRTITDKLAKYDAKGQLTCIVCQAVVSHDALWKAHVLGKEHAAAIERLKEKKRAQDAKQAPPAAAAPQPVTKSTKPALPSDFFDSSSSSSSVSASSSTSAPPPRSTAKPQSSSTSSSSSSSSSTSATASKANSDPKAVPAGFFDDPLIEMQVRQVKIEKPDFRNEMRQLERELKGSVQDAAKQSEEFLQRLQPLREREEKDAQREYEERVQSIRERGDEVKRRLEQLREERLAKRPKAAQPSQPTQPTQPTPSAAAAMDPVSSDISSTADLDSLLFIDWKAKAVGK